jgi:hypothetical protein
MPVLAAVTVNDGQATPVAHIFSPLSIDSNGVASFVDRASGIPLGYATFDLSLRSPGPSKPGQSSSGRSYKVTARLFLPTLEQTSASTSSGIQPAPTKAYDHVANLQFIMPERGTTQERKNLVALIGNLLASAAVKTAITDLEPFF